MTNKYKLKKAQDKKLAKDTISKYFALAKENFSRDKNKANNYVRKARRLAMKHKIRLPSTIKRRFCKHCYSYLVAGENLRVRTRDAKLVYYCKDCRKYMRYPIAKN